jgi:hypothetical protein
LQGHTEPFYLVFVLEELAGVPGGLEKLIVDQIVDEGGLDFDSRVNSGEGGDRMILIANGRSSHHDDLVFQGAGRQGPR